MIDFDFYNYFQLSVKDILNKRNKDNYKQGNRDKYKYLKDKKQTFTKETREKVNITRRTKKEEEQTLNSYLYSILDRQKLFNHIINKLYYNKELELLKLAHTIETRTNNYDYFTNDFDKLFYNYLNTKINTKREIYSYLSNKEKEYLNKKILERYTEKEIEEVFNNQ